MNFYPLHDLFYYFFLDFDFDVDELNVAMRKKGYVFHEFDHSLLYHIYIYLSTCDGTCAYDQVGLVQYHFF